MSSTSGDEPLCEGYEHSIGSQDACTTLENSPRDSDESDVDSDISFNTSHSSTYSSIYSDEVSTSVQMRLELRQRGPQEHHGRMRTEARRAEDTTDFDIDWEDSFPENPETDDDLWELPDLSEEERCTITITHRLFYIEYEATAALVDEFGCGEIARLFGVLDTIVRWREYYYSRIRSRRFLHLRWQRVLRARVRQLEYLVDEVWNQLDRECLRQDAIVRWCSALIPRWNRLGLGAEEENEN